MAERTSYAHGTPSWVDLGTRDIEAAKPFYAGLFGWTSADMPAPNGGTYTMFMKNDRPVAGGYTLSPEQVGMGIPPHWMTVISVDNADDVATAAGAAGGTVVTGPMDVMDAGRIAGIVGPGGEGFAVWQAGTHHGAHFVNEHGTLTWNELITDDTAAAQKFYADVLGWGAQTTTMPTGAEYTSFMAGEAPVAGMMAKMPEMGEMPNVWGAYFGVNDTDAVLAKATELGGAVFVPAMDIPEVGRMAVIGDPQGAAFSVIALADQ